MIRSIINIWNLSNKHHKDFVISIIFSFLNGMFTMMQMFAIMTAVSCLFDGTDVNKAKISVIIAAVICIIGSFITSYISQVCIMKTGMYMTADKRISLGNMLKNVHLGFFSKSSVGNINATMITTLGTVEKSAPALVIYVISGLFSSFAIFIALMFYEFRTGLITLSGMILYMMSVSWEMKISRLNAPYRQKAQSSLSDSAVSFFQGIKVTKAFCFKSGDERLKKAIDGSYDQNISLTDKSMFSQTITQLCVAMFEALIIINSLYLQHTGAITLTVAIFLIITSFMTFSSLMQTGTFLSMIGILDSAVTEVENLENTKQIEYEKPLQNIKSAEIVFDHVSFGYDNREILHDVSTVIKPGTVTAIIGPSGSGKSTMCNLIPRFWDINEGTIKIGGADIRHVKTAELMECISFVFQENYLFEDTVINNIRFGKPEASVEEVKNAARAARCDEFIEKLPEGYNTVLKEGGSSISGGEKQRIAIARAILKDSPVIILDEATSALDSENEQAVLDAINALTKNKTVIMIAHRMKIVRNADHIIALENGRIVQEGTHSELVRQDGIYSRFLKERKDATDWKIK